MNIILFSETELTRPLPYHDRRNRHIRRILKLSKGDSIKAGIINGKHGTATITKIHDGVIFFEFDLSLPPVPFRPVRIVCGLPRPQQAKRILRDCASTGVSNIWFFHAGLSEKSYQHSPLWQNNAWMHCAQEGVEQSGATLIPDVHVFADLPTCLKALPSRTNRIILDDDSSTLTPNKAFPLRETHQSETIVFVGPERGWTDDERRILRQNQCQPVSFGIRKLRTDTACIAAAVLCASFGHCCPDNIASRIANYIQLLSGVCHE
jgi:16S rRNA (uracil1498-N3)-methyltransferase